MLQVIHWEGIVVKDELEKVRIFWPNGVDVGKKIRSVMEILRFNFDGYEYRYTG